MSEDTTEVQETATDEPEATPEVRDDTWKDKEIERLRAENAKRRVQSKEDKQLIEDAKKWQEHLEGQKSDMEKLAEENARLKEDLSRREKEVLQRDLVAEFELDPDLAEFVTGADEAEMRAKAEKLAAKGALKKTSGPADLKAGNRGKPVEKDELSGGAFLEFLASEGRK